MELSQQSADSVTRFDSQKGARASITQLWHLEHQHYTPGRGKIVPCNVNNVNNVYILVAHRKGLQRF